MTPEDAKRYRENRKRKLAEDPEAMAWHLEKKRQYRQKNRDAINRRKRERYAIDPEYRLKVIADNKARKDPVQDNSCREINGETVLTYTVAQAAAMLGVTTQAIRLWIKNKDVPTPLFNGRPKLFTGRQIGLMRGLRAAGGKQEPRMRARKKAYKYWNWT